MLVGALSLMSVLSSYLVSRSVVLTTAKQSVIEHLQRRLTDSQGLLELLLLKEQLGPIRKLVAANSAQPDNILTLVVNQQGIIIATTNYEYMGEPWDSLALGTNATIVNRVRNSQTFEIDQANEDIVDGFISLCPNTPLGHKLRNQNCGFLLTRLDVTQDIAKSTTLIQQQAIYNAIGTFVIALLVSMLLHLFLVKRADRLSHTLNAFGQGQRNQRSHLNGRDEIANIARTVDNMLDRLEQDERLLKEERNRLDTLFNTIDDPIIVTNQDAQITQYNHATLKIFGYREDKMLGMSLYQLIPSLAGYIGKPFTKGLELSALNSQGQEFPIEFALAIMTIDGQPEQIAVLRDISERKAIEAQLQQHRESLQMMVHAATAETKAILDTAANAVITIDQQGIIDTFNPAAEIMFGYKASEIRGKNVSILAHGVSVEQQMALLNNLSVNAPAGIVDATREVTAERKDGSTFPARLSVGHCELDSGKHLFVGFVEDITQQKNFERELLRAKDVAEQGARTKAVFLANMSHEIRTPMNAIIGFSEILLQKADIDPQYLGLINTIRESGKNLLAIINDILDFSKIEAGKIDLESVSMPLIDTIAKALGMLQLNAQNKGLSLNFSCGKDIPAQVTGDPTRLRQVVINLVSNAIKFTEKGRVDVSIETTDDPDILRFSVRDTGCGISPEHQKEIFGAFSQGSTSTTRKYGGTGLGTTISKEIVEMMGGRIWFDSHEGQGSTFYFTARLPKASSENAQDSEASVYEIPPRKTLNILFAEDNDVNAKLVSQWFEHLDHNLTRVTDGLQAIEAFKRGGFDLIMMDIQMPHMDGISATKVIRQYEREHQLQPIAILAQTASMLETQQQSYFDAGFDLVVGKPINFSELLVTIAELSEAKGRQAQQQNQHKPQSTTPALSTEQKSQVLALIAQLHNALAELNPDVAYPYLEQLLQLIEKPRLKALTKALDGFDFDGAKAALEQLKHAIDD